jgi:hypothetical protein
MCVCDCYHQNTDNHRCYFQCFSIRIVQCILPLLDQPGMVVPVCSVDLWSSLFSALSSWAWASHYNFSDIKPCSVSSAVFELALGKKLN